MKITARQRRCLIEATIDDLTPFPRGFDERLNRPQFEEGAHAIARKTGALRIYRPVRGKNRIKVTARAA